MERLTGQGERVTLDATVVQPQTSDGQDVRRARIKDEGGLELRRLDGVPLGPEPACAGELLPIQVGEDPRDLRAGRSLGAAQILSITCLTTV